MKSDMQVHLLDINGMKNPIGIDSSYPTFHYVAESLNKNKFIGAYQIIVTDEDEHIFWDSGKTTTTTSAYVKHQGKALVPKTVYYAKIRLWDEENHPSNYSDPLYFETGFLDSSWDAHWIEPIQECAINEKELPFFKLFVPNPEFWGGEERLKPCQDLRKDFCTRKKVKKARVYASAHGIYQLYINGNKIGGRRLAPETSVYDKILYYQTYDVSDFINKGNNTVGVTLADGWWIGRLGISGDSCNYGEKTALILQLEITYEDDEKEVIISDDSFCSKESMIQYSDLYIGEKQDFTKEELDWKIPDYKDKDWQPCNIVNETKDTLIGQFIEGITVTQQIPVNRVIITPKSELVFDFGQVISGVCRFEINGKEGQRIEFEHSEVLDKEGNYKNNVIGRNKDQKDVVICKEGKQVFEPLFTYHGFRYVKIKGIHKEQINGTALVIGTPIAEVGLFNCQDKRINQLQHAIKWSTIGNMCSIPTDCPQREKLGWTGDIQVFAKTGLFNYDLKGFLEGWLMNLKADQFENGEVPVTVPNHPYQDKMQRMLSNGSNSSSGWGDACVLVPFYMYLQYNDKSILEDNIEVMEKWLEFVRSQALIKPDDYETMNEDQKARQPYLWTKGYHFGDWLIPSLRSEKDGVALGTKYTKDVVGACFYAITLDAYIQICNWLGEDEKAADYTELLKHVRGAIKEEFVLEDGSIIGKPLQGLYVMILKSGAINGFLKKKVTKKLVELIEENDNHLDTGFSSVSYILDCLYDNGYPELAYRLLYQNSAPSWLYMIEKGATTLWENWKAIDDEGEITDSSYNHYAFGCVGDWVYRHIGGIKVLEPGYKLIEISPDYDLCGLEYANVSTRTPHGKLSVSWKKLDKKIVLDVEIPVDTIAKVFCNNESINVNSGQHHLVLDWL